MGEKEQIAAELYKLAGRFTEIADGYSIINGKKAVLMKPEVLKDVAGCFADWADRLLLLDNREEGK